MVKVKLPMNSDAIMVLSFPAEYGATLGVISYGVLWMPMRLLQSYSLPHILRLFTGILPHVPMVWFWRELCLVEMNGKLLYSDTSSITVSVAIRLVF